MQALIFDFDGLIIDSETPDYDSWREVYQARGAELPLDMWAGLIGKSTVEGTFDPYNDLESQIGQPINRGEIRKLRRARYADMVEQQPILPGVLAYIAEAQRLGLKLAVASSGTRDWVEPNLARLGIRDVFATICCADDVERAKPDPALYQLACEQLRVPTTAAIAFEDSLNGVQAAKSAGLYTVAVPNPMTRHFDFAQADLQLTSLAELPLSALLEQAQHALSS